MVDDDEEEKENKTTVFIKRYLYMPFPKWHGLPNRHTTMIHIPVVD